MVNAAGGGRGVGWQCCCSGGGGCDGVGGWLVIKLRVNRLHRTPCLTRCVSLGVCHSVCMRVRAVSLGASVGAAVAAAGDACGRVLPAVLGSAVLRHGQPLHHGNFGHARDSTCTESTHMLIRTMFLPCRHWPHQLLSS